MRPGAAGEGAWRHEAPHVLAALLRRHGDLGACEDAVQEALLVAAVQWPRDGVPDRPRAWLVRVASRRLIDRARHDDAARVPLTLRAVAGLSTRQIAVLLMLPEPTVAQRISRAKAALRQAGPGLVAPTAQDLPDRLPAVRHVLHLIFTAGHTATAGTDLMDVALATEAIRLTDVLHRATPGDPETAGLLALMLLSHARAGARLTAGGDLVPLAEQDRSRWDVDLITRGVALVEQALPHGEVGPFQLQAAIAAVHAEAATSAATDWLQITVLYRMLAAAAPSPVVALNLAAAIGMAHGPDAGLTALAPLLADPALAGHHRLHATHAHLLHAAGRDDAAREAFARAARLATSIPEQRYLNARAVGPV